MNRFKLPFKIAVTIFILGTVVSMFPWFAFVKEGFKVQCIGIAMMVIPLATDMIITLWRTEL